MKIKRVRVNSVKHFIEILEEAEEEWSDFYIQFGIARSSKEIRLLKKCPDARTKQKYVNKIEIHNEIDGTMQLITIKQLKSETNIVKAIENKVFYYEH